MGTTSTTILTPQPCDNCSLPTPSLYYIPTHSHTPIYICSLCLHFYQSSTPVYSISFTLLPS